MNTSIGSFRLFRALFPALTRDNPGIYLDNAATTHKLQAVVDAVTEVYTISNAPIHRSLYAAAEDLTERYEAVRAQIGQWMGAEHSSEIVLTHGTTDGINTFVGSWAPGNIGPGDEIVVTLLDHHSVTLPWSLCARTHGARLVTLPLRTDGSLLLDLQAVRRLITHRTKIVILPLSSNVRGPLLDEEIEAVVLAARSVGALLFFDGAQVPAHAPIDLRRWSPDVLVWSGHKCFAPTGVGVLYIRRALHMQLEPYQCGGGMVYDASGELPLWQSMPTLLEAGTRPVEGIIGLGAAVNYLATLPYAEVRAHEAFLVTTLIEGIKGIPGMHILGDLELLKRDSSLVTFAIEGLHAHDIAAYLAYHNIAVRAGHHCCQQLHAMLGMTSSVRVSFALYNTIAEAEYTVQIIRDAVSFLRS